MSGPITLKSRKALLTRYSNNLKRTLEKFETNVTKDWSELRDTGKLGQTQQLLWELQETSNLVLDALSSFTAAADSLGENLDEEQEKQAQDYIDSTQTLLDRAITAAVETDAHIKTARDQMLLSEDGTTFRGTLEPTRPKLPAIPIPIFSGKVWEFKNFWTLFRANVHDQPLTKLQKFNYLLNALRGEARELVKRYAVTEENYDLAVELMHKKYENNSKLIDQLQTRLEAARADNSTTQAQRRLLEFIIPIVTQLEHENVNLDGSYSAKKILAKFAVPIQRKLLETWLSRDMSESDWKMQDLLKELDQHITTEERISDMVKAKNVNNDLRHSSKDLSALVPKNSLCMFCKSSYHKSSACTKYSSIAERRNTMLERKQCLNCGKPGHFVTQCKSQGCRNCKGARHHHTLCPQLLEGKKEDPPRAGVPIKKKEITHSGREQRTRNEKTLPRRPTVARTNLVHSQTAIGQDESQESDSDRQESVVLQTTQKADNGTKCVLLLTGCARVKQAQDWKEVEILFDTGADRSFISETLAQQLGLDGLESQKLTMHTFGREDPITATCKVVTIDIWDLEGRRHPVQVYTTPVLLGVGKATHLTQADLAFLTRHSIHLSKMIHKGPSTPHILLGCDQLWNFLESMSPQHTLPSGLKLIPSKLGYLLTGRQGKASEQTDNSRHTAEETVVTVNCFTNFEDELTRWDKYWTMDSSGVYEFNGTKDAEKKAVEKKVSEFFDQTIERREDGYYVRFPYKDNHPPLPSNRAIALKRLSSVLQMLKARPDVLKEYEGTFVSQKEKGIIEEIPNNWKQEGPVLHYIPHQPVITPHKETTKLRIVFDASSHFVDQPSLNDILHQGPLILPELHAMLLRFRIPTIVAISDVEKAFLQVRLHELDRDATRFLWVRDIYRPLSEDNLVTYRFTRVTFGLNVSPFLLAGTIHHHLRSAVENEKIADEIRDNLYVDNLVLAADSAQEIQQKANEARQIFADMGMNLREFLSNDPSLRDNLPEDAYAKHTTQKVLGILWDAETDRLQMHCKLPKSDRLTKRIVAQRIASIYDPFGWLVPLLIQAKRFQQNLWRQKYQWDSELPHEVKQEWETISENADGFQRSISRRFLSDIKTGNLAVFADASDIAISCCAYIFNSEHSSLAMAKSKLPSIHSKTTTPKLEMNALTLGTRLANSVLQAIENALGNKPRSVVLFSDSQIALSWLALPPNAQLGRLVENRMKEIREIVGSLESRGVSVEFRYINTKENPADAGTRGLTKDQLKQHIWWTGPEFLSTPSHQWLSPVYKLTRTYTDTTLESITSPESPETVAILHTQAITEGTVASLIDLSRCRSLTMAERVTATVLIFIKKLFRTLPPSRANSIIKNLRIENIPDTLPALDGAAVRAAKLALVRNHQTIFLGATHRKTMENTLRPFQDENHIWRSKGRFGNSLLSENAKHPILISPNTALARLIIVEAHGAYHRGIEHTMATIRTQYWIPKLRQQVRKLVQTCVMCRRFNGLPFSYPDSTDLPERRVARSRPFQHVGLDFFDLPQSQDDGTQGRPSGCIFTCTVTRLVHLETVDSMNTEDFINALRRFIARRGIPDSITCDNAPTFLLSARILAEGPLIREEILRATSKNEIQWRFITPYAPWQGGFYERLIKSVKHALYKSLRGSLLRSKEHLRTSLVEIEACLNSRPLTYQAATQEELTVIRPIDFIQRDLSVTLPHETLRSTAQDPDYHPPDELRELRTRQNVIEALEASCKATERFWTIWKEQYLTGLREKHKKLLTNHRSCKEAPKVGEVVLVSDPVLSRNDWRLARITKLKPSSDGETREVELVTATKRTIRRPVNLLVPLEIGDTDHVEGKTDEETRHPQRTTPPRGTGIHQYNLRNRPSTRQEVTAVAAVHSKSPRLKARWFLFHLMLWALIDNTLGSLPDIKMKCTNQGVLVLTTTGNNSIEICADHYCQQRKIESPQIIKFPPDITLHEHSILIKWNSGGKLATLETTCPGLDFCENIDCSFCTHVLLNPECRPLQALLMVMITLYGIVAVTYTLLYVPLTIGKPIRLLLKGTALTIVFLTKNIGRCACKLLRKIFGRRRRTQRERIIAALAILTYSAILLLSTAHACQNVNIFEHNSTLCTRDIGGEKCRVNLIEMMKLNSFKQEACLRVAHKSSLIATIKIRWKGLYLRCEEETLYFTRPIVLKTLDAKRCPHMGSCGAEKCAQFNTSTLVPELEEANRFPGRTGCMESCGGWGCDCFYPSSGCLFYRIYAVPTSQRIYEIFRCTRWTEEIKMEITIEGFQSEKGKKRYVFALTPNIPLDIPLEGIRITATTVTLPPIPPLHSTYITNGEETAIWDRQSPPNLICGTSQEAISGNCSLVEDCRCSPAENKVNCVCSITDVEEEFNKIGYKLPVKTVAWELKKRTNGPLVSKIPHMVAADIIIEFQQTVDIATLAVQSSTCSISDAALQGCYSCAKGAQAKVRCHADSETLGEIICDNHAFVVSCAPHSPESILRFHFDTARQLLNCSITCGAETKRFVLSGILKYLGNIQTHVSTLLQGNNVAYHEIAWPDFNHITSVFFSWYKMVILGLILLTMTLLLSYLYIQTLAIRLLRLLLKALSRLAYCPVKIVIFILKSIRAKLKEKDMARINTHAKSH